MSTETPKPEQKRETAAQAYKKEVADLRPRLPRDYRIRFFKMYPAYDNYSGGVLLHNIIMGRSTDLAVLEGLKEIVRIYEAEQVASGKGTAE